MRASTMRISVADMHKLAGNPSPQTRADVAGKIASTLSAGAFNDSESIIALEILRLLVRDAEVRVRRAVSISLRDSMNIPRDVAITLASDVEEVAVPLLRYSYVLTEEDLVEIVRATREVAKLVAVASRDSVSTELSEALIETDVTDVMGALFANRGAQIKDEHLLSRWERISADRALLDMLVHRGGLSTPVAEKLYSAVADELKPVLTHMYRLPMALVEEAADDAREWATLGLTAGGEIHEPTEQEVEKLVNHLYITNRLTYSLIMRSLCVGDLAFFETALARLAGVPRTSARLLLFDNGPLGFKAFYEKARMPDGFYDAIHMLLRVSLEETGYGRLRREDFRSRVIARIQSAGYDRSIENMQYLLTIIGGKVATPEARP